VIMKRSMTFSLPDLGIPQLPGSPSTLPTSISAVAPAPVSALQNRTIR